MDNSREPIEVEDSEGADGDAGDSGDVVDAGEPAESNGEAFGSEDAFEALISHLRDARGFDFTGYKRASLRRRIHRRMTQVGVADYTDYVDLLQVDGDEFVALFNTILINVTAFFRDPDTWDYLRESAVPELVAKRTPGTPLRVWSAGCASGEEAYSLAIVLAEVLGVERFREDVKIYATDVDEDALTVARHASYTDEQLKTLPAGLRDRYFENRGGRRLFRGDLRRSVIFGRNDLLRDAPISRVDLIACRNTLMYFTAHAQAGVISRLQFALNPGGLLVLGKAEMLLNRSDVFEPVNLQRRVLRRLAEGAAPPVAPGPAFPLERRAEVGPLVDIRDRAFHVGPVAQLVLTADDTVALINQQAEDLFGLTRHDVGRPLRDLVLSYRPVELRAMVEQARTERESQRLTGIALGRPGSEPLWLEVHITPLLDSENRLIGTTIAYHDVTTTHRLFADLEQANLELTNAFEALQSTGEELETTNEELQSTVEELETTNEELQSTNEELETMNEELRSTNDELQRINEAVDRHSGEVIRLNGLLESILASLQGAVVAMDTELRVTVWNDRAQELWGLRSEEVVGQHLFNLDIGLPVDQLRPAIRASMSLEATPSQQRVTAVNRRGRTVEVDVRVTTLLAGGTVSGAMLVME